MSKNRQSSNRQAFNAQGLYSKTLKRRKKRLGFTIDDDAAKLLDDGLQITLQNNGDYFVEFFIADTPLYFETIGDKPRLKKSGRNETSAPRSIFIEYFGLKEHDQNKDRPAIRVSMTFDKKGHLKSHDFDRVSFFNMSPLTKSAANDDRKNNPYQWKLWDSLACKIQQNYINPTLHDKCQKDLVYTFATLVNGLLADYALKNNLPILYQCNRIELKQNNTVYENMADAKKDAVRLGIINQGEDLIPREHYSLQKSHTVTTPSTITSLKLSHYARFTSPLRRVSDAINLQVLIHHLENKPQLYTKQEIQDIADLLDTRHKQEINKAKKRRINKKYKSMKL